MTRSLDNPRQALILLDMQNDIVHPDGAFGRDGGGARAAQPGGALDNAAVLLAGHRAAGALVVHVGVAFRPGYPDADPAVPLSKACIDRGCLLEGSWGAEFIERLMPEPTEPRVIKRGMSALAGTDLDLILRLADVRTIVLAGVATDLVVEATARQAVDLGYHVVIAVDASSGTSDGAHVASIAAMEHFALIRSTAQVCDALEGEHAG